MVARSRTEEDLRALVAAGVLDVVLAERAAVGERGLATCWCGYDLAEHDDAMEDGDDGTIRDHGFVASGTKWIAWLLGVSRPFDHEHNADDEDTAHPVSAYCVLCRIERWEASHPRP